MTTSGRVLERLGCGYGLDVGQFIAPHGICVDSHKSIYVGEVSHTSMSHTTTPPRQRPVVSEAATRGLIMARQRDLTPELWYDWRRRVSQ